MVRGFPLPGFLAASAASGENDPAMRIAAIEARIGVAAVDTSNDKHLDNRAEERFPPGRGPIPLAIYSIGSTATANDREATVADVARIVAESL
jgi:hypothetical protein